MRFWAGRKWFRGEWKVMVAIYYFVHLNGRNWGKFLEDLIEIGKIELSSEVFNFGIFFKEFQPSSENKADHSCLKQLNLEKITSSHSRLHLSFPQTLNLFRPSQPPIARSARSPISQKQTPQSLQPMHKFLDNRKQKSYTFKGLL